MSNYFTKFDNILNEFKEINFSRLLNMNLNDINMIIRKHVNRIIVIPLETTIIGHFAVNTEELLRYYYLHKKEYDKRGEIIILINDKPKEMIVNRQLYAMIKRKIPVIDSSNLINFIKLLVKNDPKLWNLNKLLHYSSILNYDVFDNGNPQLTFNKDEEIEGKKLLKTMGIEDEPYICFHNRDSAYWDKRRENEVHFHDYRDNDIKNYMLAVKYMNNKGYSAVRMGKIVKEKLETKSSNIVDYASYFRSDFGDVYVTSKCKFFIGNSSGIVFLPIIQNIPSVLVDVIPLGFVTSKRDIYIPKKYWYISEKRFLKFSEVLDSKIYRWGIRDYNYSKLGIEVINNTSDEILDVTKEMYSRLNGTWITNEEDNELQNKFRNLYKKGCPAFGNLSRVGAEFLRQNGELIE